MKNCFNKYLWVTLLLYASTPLLLAQQEFNPIRQGNRNYNKENYTEAEVDYRRGLNINDQSYEGHYNLGNALFRDEKYPEAAAEFAKAAENLDRKKDKARFAQTMHNLGNACFAQQQYDKAVVAYQESLRANPKDNDTRYNLAKALTLLQQQQQQQNQQNQQDQQQQQNQNQQNQQNQQDQQQEQQQNQDQDNQTQNTEHQNQNQMDKETAEQILQALEQDEQQTQEKLQRQQGQKRTVEKEW